jgi:hypothetical protein
MEPEKEIRAAVLAILKAHDQMRSDYHELLCQLHAIKPMFPQALRLLRPTEVANNVLKTEAADLVRHLEDALKGNQPFAALLQEYASLWEPPLNEHIQSLTRAGFQTVAV